MKKSILFLILLVISNITLLHALPSLGGSTGLIKMPTAEILTYKEYNAAYDYQVNLDESDDSLFYYKFNVGALENAELGFVGGSSPEEGVFLNFKWNLSSNSGRFPLKMALGFENITAKSESDFYIVASKRLSTDLGIHGGFKALFNTNIDVSFMTGIDYSYSEKLLFMSDLTSQENSLYYINAGVVYQLYVSDDLQNVYVRISLENLLRNTGEDSYLNVGLSYTTLF